METERWRMYKKVAQRGSNLKRTIETLCSDLDPKTIDDFFFQMDRDYFSLYTPEEISRHIRMLCSLDRKHPIQVNITPQGEGRFDIVVVAFDYFSEFSIICGLLAASGFDIQTGNIYTLSRRWADPLSGRIIDIFNVHLRNGEAFDAQREKGFKDELEALIKLLGEGLFLEAMERVNRYLIEHLERVKRGFAGLLYPVEIRFDNHISRRWTIMDVRSIDTPAFLYAFSNALSMRDIYIHKVRIEGVGREVWDRFYISDRQGNKIEGEDGQKRLRMAVALIKQFTHFLSVAPDPAKALQHFDQLLDKFMEEKRPGHAVSFLSEKEGLDLLAHLLGASDFLWEDFLRMQFESLMPILEGFRGRGLRKGEEIRVELASCLTQGKTYEEKKRILNQFKDREIFFIDMKHLMEPKVTLTDFSRGLTDLADAALDQAYLVCHQRLMDRYGRPTQEDGAESPFSICGLGKFGGREMGYASDIELLLLYDGKGHTDGRDPIDNGLYFEQLARELVGFIEAKREGIFHVDLRLRPYGRAGSLVNSIEQLMAYYSPEGEAAPFERQALIKLRWVAGDESLGRRMEAHRDNFVYSDMPWDMKAALHLRGRQVHELVGPDKVNVKYSPGGVIDIEYAVQYLQILHGKDHPELKTPSTLEALDSLRSLKIISQEEHDILRKGYIFLRRLIDALRIVRGNARDLLLPEETSLEYKFLARRLGYIEDNWERAAGRLSEDIRSHMLNVNQFFISHFKAA